MSLLINALQKAEQGRQQPLEKAEIEDFLLDLAPAEPARSHDAVQSGSGESSTPSPAIDQAAQLRAAQLLAAKSVAMRRETRISPFTLGLLLLLLILLIGGAVFWYVNSLAQPEVIVPRPAILNAVPHASAPVVTEEQSQEAPEEVALGDTSEPAVMPVIEQPSSAIVTPRPVTQAAALPPVFGEVPKEPIDSRVAVTRNRTGLTVNQHVLAGYQAFNQGNDAAAQQAYRQALQADARNLDALLGMAAIAARQEYQQNAVNWYQQVLQVEPRNEIAQAALLDLQGQADPLNSETRLKNLISQQPDAAYLHAALGNHYADQAQWPLAQQAYFQAYHLDAANPEYAFNLAISLDQLGKPSLALQYYLQAQSLLAGNASANIDQAQLAARIRQLQ